MFGVAGSKVRTSVGPMHLPSVGFLSLRVVPSAFASAQLKDYVDRRRPRHRNARAVTRLIIVATCVVLAGLLQAPASAAAADCRIGNSGVTYNRLGEPARFTSLRAMSGMNCASARYVLNRWLRREYARQYSSRIPTEFFDGYVTWYCFKLSRFRWHCDEFESYTAFRFTAYRY